MQIKPKLRKQDVSYTGLSSFLKHHWNSEICVTCLHVCFFLSPLCSWKSFTFSSGNKHLISSKMRFLKKGDAFVVCSVSHRNKHGTCGRAVTGISAAAAALSDALSPWKHFSRRGTYWRPEKDFPIALQKRHNVSCSEYSIFPWPWICKRWQARGIRSFFSFFSPLKNKQRLGKKGDW